MVSPVTVTGLPAPKTSLPPGLAVTMYELIVLPSDTGAEKATVTWLSPGVADVIVGISGTVAVPGTFTAVEAVDATPVPIALVAVTLNVRELPTASPLKVIGELVPRAVSPSLDVTV